MFPKAGELFCSPEEYKEMCTITVSIVVVAVDVVVFANDAAVVASVWQKIVLADLDAFHFRLPDQFQ